MQKRLKYQTLHSHTIASDGLLTHAGVLNVCSKNKIGLVAFTDHDSLPGEKIVKNLRDGFFPTKWIIGIEISAGKPIDFEKKFNPHIIGLFVDPFNKELIKHCRKSQEARIQRMSYMVKRLKDLGFDLTGKDCLKASKGESVGRPHIVQAIKSKKENIKVIENLRKKMEQDAKRDSSLKIKYDRMIERGEGQYPYVLFLSEDSYIKGVYIDYPYLPSLDDSVALIRNAGGLAFFAHWFTEIDKCNESSIEKLLKEDRLDGVETIYGFYDDIEEEFKKQRKILVELVDKYHKLESGGVDAHTKEHFEEFSRDSWYAGLTIGLIEKILSSGKLDNKWSCSSNI